MPPKSSCFWDYFKVTNDNKAKCNICQKELSRTGGSTSNLKKHLEHQHPREHAEAMEKRTNSSTDQQSDSVRDEAKKSFKQQQTLEAALTRNKKWAPDDPRTVSIDNKISEMIALDDLPFSSVQDLGFMRLMHEVSPNYKLKTRNFYKTVMEQQFKQLTSKLFSEISKNKEYKISLTTDNWSNTVEALFSLTAHLITSDFQRIMFVLNVSPMGEQRHTAEYLAEKFEQLLENWKIEKKDIFIVLRDSGSNILKAMNDLEVENKSCAAHDLNLVVRKALDQQQIVRDLVVACKKIATHFHKSDASRKRLAGIQQRLEPDKVPLKIVQESATRWNSTFEMIKRIKELEESIKFYACEAEVDWNLNWNIMPKLINALKPFNEATELLSKSAAMLSDVIPTVKWLKAKIEVGTSDERGIGSFMDCLRFELAKRFDSLEQNINCTTATFLDPRYKDRAFNHKITSEEVKKNIDLCVKNMDAETHPPAKKSKTVHRQAGEMSNIGSMAEYFGSSDEETQEENIEASAVDKEIKAYVQEKRLPLNEDPLGYWKNKTEDYPNLATLARQYLSAPATSVPSERVFSGAGLIYKPQRRRLKGETTEKLLFLKFNLAQLKFNY